MNLHEYQSKEVFREFGIPVPPGRAARSADEAVDAAKSLGGQLWVVKAQVHAGGRGKAGGVKLARDLEAVRAATADMLGKRLVTKQTGPEGLPIETVYVECGSETITLLVSTSSIATWSLTLTAMRVMRPEAKAARYWPAELKR